MGRNCATWKPQEDEYAWFQIFERISDLSNARNLEELNLSECRSLVTLSSSIQNAIKLIYLDMRGCTKLESFPTHLNLESLEYLGLLYYDNLRKISLCLKWKLQLLRHMELRSA